MCVGLDLFKSRLYNMRHAVLPRRVRESVFVRLGCMLYRSDMMALGVWSPHSSASLAHGATPHVDLKLQRPTHSYGL